MAIINFLAGKIVSLKNDGTANAGGKVYFYTADGTYSTPIATYLNVALSVANTNPVVLDSSGRAKVYFSGNADVKITDSDDVLIYTERDISPQSVTTVFSKALAFTIDSTYLDTIVETTAALTISLTSAATLGTGFTATIINTSAGLITLSRLNAGDTINNVAANKTIPANSSATIYVNAGETGFLINSTDTSTGLNLVDTQTASASADLEFTLDDTYRTYIFEFDKIVLSGPENIEVYVAVASVYLVTGYERAAILMTLETTPAASYAGADGTGVPGGKIVIASNLSADTTIGGSLELQSPGVAGIYKTIEWHLLVTPEETATQGYVIVGGATNTSDTGAINLIKFVPSAGTITSGTIRMYGMKK